MNVSLVVVVWLKHHQDALSYISNIREDAMKVNGPLYDQIFRRLEASRWALSDIPFDRVDSSRMTEETLEFVRVNCLMELSSLYAVRMFLRDFRGDTDFCQFMSIWYYEEMKHYLVFREYLKVFGREPGEEDLPSLDTELSPAPWPRTLVIHYCGELRLGMWYHRWSKVFEEPVLKSIYQLIGNDEYRHAQCYEEFMIKSLEKNPAVLLDFLQAAKWMLVNPEGDKHPTTVRTNGPDELSVVERIPGYQSLFHQLTQTISDDDEKGLQSRVLVTLSRLSGQDIKTLRDLSAYTRSLQDKEKERSRCSQEIM